MKNKEQSITADQNIGEIAQKHPEVMGIFMKYGLHCIGCAAAHFENLEQGCKAHGMDDKTIKKLVEEANKAVKEKS